MRVAFLRAEENDGIGHRIAATHCSIPS